MVANSKIEWTDHTFNPWVGCEKISPACDNCYAETWARRTGNANLWSGERRRTTPQYWRQPYKWNRMASGARVRPRVFCASLADVFDNAVPREWRRDLFDVIELTPNLDWLLLTKRIGNAMRLLPSHDWAAGRRNVWLGITVANQAEADRDIPKLQSTPAHVRFLSCEPLLDLVNLREWLSPCGYYCDHGDFGEGHRPERSRIDWVIVGGESGPGARSMPLPWAAEIVKDCRDAGVACFVKQLGSKPVDAAGDRWPQINAKGGDIREFPEWLRVREFPRAA